MSTATQQLFRRIVLHNKLLPEAKLDELLSETPQPENAVERMVKQQFIQADMGKKLLKVYHSKIQQLAAPTGGNGGANAAEPAAAEPVAEASAVRDTSASASGEPVADEKPEPEAREAEPSTTAPTKPTVAKPDEVPPISVTAGGEKLMYELLQRARQIGASDLHIKPDMVPTVRAAGTLKPLGSFVLSEEICEQSLISILDDEQKQMFAETNDLDFCYDAGPPLGRFRANLMREHRGIDGVFRPIAERVPSFEELSLPEIVKGFTKYRVGIVLVTGPKGCGKTTTLAAMIDLINSTRQEHIITIEDPIEFVHPCKKGHVNQRQVGPHTKSFGNALRSALREAPDVIMVGEMRDIETTSLAITAAETGHLVFATLHTPDAIRTIGRVLDVFPPKEQGQIRAMVSESLRGVVSQLLVPGKDGNSMELALEVLVNTPAIGHLIRDQRVHQIRGLMQTGKKQGMLLMDESLVKLAKEGRISKDAALARAEEVNFVEKELEAVKD